MPSSERVIYEKTSTATQEKILDAAQTLFTEKGFAGTSLRAIANLAAVNLAATHYHFGSKEGLFAATIDRRVRPVNEARISNLDRLESDRDYRVASIVAAFLDPLLSVDPSLPRLFARVHNEPASISGPLLEKVFGGLFKRYVTALEKALPEVSSQDLQWRLYFVIGSMVHLLNSPFAPPVVNDASRQEGIEKLKLFAIAGLMQENIKFTESEEDQL